MSGSWIERVANWTCSYNKYCCNIRKKTSPFLCRLVPNEEETAAERCSEKLVDLVVLLTTKLDNNVEDLRKELTDNINENIERFERVQQQQEEEYGNKSA